MEWGPQGDVARASLSSPIPEPAHELHARNSLTRSAGLGLGRERTKPRVRLRLLVLLLQELLGWVAAWGRWAPLHKCAGSFPCLWSCVHGCIWSFILRCPLLTLAPTAPCLS